MSDVTICLEKDIAKLSVLGDNCLQERDCSSVSENIVLLRVIKCFTYADYTMTSYR